MPGIHHKIGQKYHADDIQSWEKVVSEHVHLFFSFFRAEDFQLNAAIFKWKDNIIPIDIVKWLALCVRCGPLRRRKCGTTAVMADRAVRSFLSILDLFLGFGPIERGDLAIRE